MANVLHTHTPSEAVRKRAEVADIDLDTLKQRDPQHYKMLNAEPVVEVSSELAEMAISVFLAAFPHYEVFRLESDQRLSLLAFPPLTPAEQAKFDNALARLASHPRYAAQYAFFRTVTDKQGEHRQFALALAPAAWQQDVNVLVGPFASEAEARAWSDTHINGTALLSDTVLMSDTVHQGNVPQGSNWFVDVFAGA